MSTQVGNGTLLLQKADVYSWDGQRWRRTEWLEQNKKHRLLFTLKNCTDTYIDWKFSLFQHRKDIAVQYRSVGVEVNYPPAFFYADSSFEGRALSTRAYRRVFSDDKPFQPNATTTIETFFDWRIGNTIAKLLPAHIRIFGIYQDSLERQEMTAIAVNVF